MDRFCLKSRMSPDQFYAEFGKNVRRVRTEESKKSPQGKFTQEKLANAVGLTRSSIANIESGNQKILLHQIFDFAEALGVTPQVLLPSADSNYDSSLDEQFKDKFATKNQRELVRNLIQTAKQ